MRPTAPSDPPSFAFRARLACSALVLLALLPRPAVGLPSFPCTLDDQPAATLLLPYFEVDLDGGRTTLFAITNVSAGTRLARVTLWTDWSLPTLSFDLYLPPNDVQTINLRDVLNTAQGPITGPGAEVFPGCAATVGGAAGWTGARLQAAHTGRPAPPPAAADCYSEPRADTSLATGYITVDATSRCPAVGTSPATPGYFGGATPVAANLNALIGDYFHVDPGQNYAGGQNAVHIVADAAFASGDYTFYGRYVGFDGSDKRNPLPEAWRARFLIGGPFDGGTDLIVWRDTRSNRIAPYACGLASPLWRPLGESYMQEWNEQGQDTTRSDTQYFDLATQRVPVASLDFPDSFGYLVMVLAPRHAAHAQAWVGWQAQASSRFNVSLAGAPLFGCSGLNP